MNARHSLARLAVCSRSAEYEALCAQLRLQGAIVLQPLTREQVDAYLQNAGEQLASVRALLERDAVLQELAESPLMLSIMVLAYADQDVDNLPTLDSTEERRKHLFDTYIRRMFERRGDDKRYAPHQTTHWLSWLGQQMVEHSQTTFYLELMRPEWLHTRIQQAVHRIMAGLITGSTLMLGFGPIVWQVNETSGGVKGLIWLVGWLGGGQIGWLLLGLLFWLILVLLTLSWPTDFKLAESLKWSWKEGISPLAFGLAVGLIFGLVVGLVDRRFNGLFTGLVLGTVLGLCFALFSGLTTTEIEIKAFPGQGIQRSLRNAVFVGLVFGLDMGLGFGLVFWQAQANEMVWLGFMLVGGLSFWLFLGLAFGGKAVIDHYALRISLTHSNQMPLNYIPFLDYAAERIFLRKVGGGYIFVHRLLMEHFASLEK